MWEIILTASDYVVWRCKDSEGRYVYACTGAPTIRREPISSFAYSKAAAIDIFCENQEIMASLNS